MNAIHGKFVIAGNLRLWTEQCGDPADPPILLVMGTSTPGAGWPDELVEALAAGGRQVIRFDHRDTGRSDCVDFTATPYTMADMAADAIAVLDGYGIVAAHIAGASLGGAIGQWLAVHRPERVLSLTAIMTGPMGHSAGPAFARALAGLEPDPHDLPPPTPRFLRHLAGSATVAPAGRAGHIARNVETWRVLNGDVLPFDEPAARRLAETAYDLASDHAAAANHDPAGRTMTDDRLVPLSSIAAPTLVVHGTEDPLRPLPHGEALAAQIPHARLTAVPGMGHSFLSPGLPRRIGEIILDHTSHA
nr:alpha/beta hydrolase [Rhizohabitans arisaemae]